MCAKSSKVLVNVNVSIQMPEISDVTGNYQAASNNVSGVEDNKNSNHQSQSMKPSETQSQNKYTCVVSPCQYSLHLPDKALSATCVPSSVDLALRNADSIIAMGQALPDCFELNPYHQNVSPTERSLNTRERCLDSVREIVRLPADLFSKTKDSSFHDISTKEGVSHSFAVSPSDQDTTTSRVQGRNRWYSSSSLRELEAIPSFSKQVCVRGKPAIKEQPKDISVSPAASPVPPNRNETLGQPDSQQSIDGRSYTLESLRKVFDVPTHYFDNDDATKTATSPPRTTDSQGEIRMARSLGSLGELPCNTETKILGHVPPLLLTNTLAKQYYLLVPVEKPSEFNDVRQTNFFIAKPLQPDEDTLQTPLLFSYTEEVSVRSPTTNAYAYLKKKERHLLSTESMVDIKQVPLPGFSPKMQEKEQK